MTAVSRRDKLLERMRENPRSVRFEQVVALLGFEGFVLFNQRGSHCTFHRADGRVLTLVRPHGGCKTCQPDDIRRILGALGL